MLGLSMCTLDEVWELAPAGLHENSQNKHISQFKIRCRNWQQPAQVSVGLNTLRAAITRSISNRTSSRPRRTQS